MNKYITILIILVFSQFILSVPSYGFENMVCSNLQTSNLTDSIKKRDSKSAIENDSTKNQIKDLPELEVEAKQQSMQLGRFEYIPSKREKNISIDAISLLGHMRIPQITVLNGVVSANLGGKISYFINGIPANMQDLSSMNMKNVRKVIYLDYPSDAGYMGAERVIDFIVTEYEYGGYTKLMERNNFLSYSKIDGILSSKFNYKKSSFILYALASYYDAFKSGSEFKEKISFENYDIIRESISNSSKSKTTKVPVMLTYRLTNNQTLFSTSLTYHYQKDNRSSSSSNILNGKQIDFWEQDSRPQRQNALSWSGNFSTNFGKGWRFASSTSVNHYTTSTSFLKDFQEHSNIYYSIHENVWNYIASINLSKTFGKGSLTTMAQYYNYRTSNNYSGNIQETNAMQIQNEFIHARYSLVLSKFRFNTRADIIADQIKSNSESSSYIKPAFSVGLEYMPNYQHQLALSVQRINGLPQKNEYNNTLLQTDMYIYTMGNPLLKSYSITDFSIPYTYMKGSMSIGFYNTFRLVNNRIASQYSIYPGHDALLKTFINSGNCKNFDSNVVYDHSLFRNKLRLYLSAAWHRSHISKPNPITTDLFNARAYVAWYYKNFYTSGSYTHYWGKSLAEYSYETMIRNRPLYYISAGWGNGNLAMELNIINLFNKSWKGNIEEYVSPLYSNTKIAIGPTYRQKINISISYTFDYGKKIQRQDFSTNGVQTESSIGL